MPPESVPDEPSGEERCTLILVLVTLLGILIGEGVGFRVEGSALCGMCQGQAPQHGYMRIYSRYPARPLSRGGSAQMCPRTGG